MWKIISVIHFSLSWYLKFYAEQCPYFQLYFDIKKILLVTKIEFEKGFGVDQYLAKHCHQMERGDYFTQHYTSVSILTCLWQRMFCHVDSVWHNERTRESERERPHATRGFFSQGLREIMPANALLPG